MRNRTLLALGSPDFDRSAPVAETISAGRGVPHEGASPAAAPGHPAAVDRPSAAPGPSVLAVGGGPAARTPAATSATPGSSRSSRSACDLLSTKAFEPLPGTQVEAERIIDLWSRIHPDASGRGVPDDSAPAPRLTTTPMR